MFKLKQPTKRFISISLGTAMIVGSLVIYFNFIKPAYEDIQLTKKEKIEQEKTIAIQQEAISRVQSLIERYKEKPLQEAISLALPLEPKIPDILVQVYGILTNNGMDVKSIGLSVSRSAVRRAGPRGARSDSIIKPFGKINIRVSLSGSYEDFKKMLKDLETNIRVFEVSTFSLVPSIKDKKELTAPIVSLDESLTSPPSPTSTNETSTEGIETKVMTEEEILADQAKILGLSAEDLLPIPPEESVEKEDYRFSLSINAYYQLK